jgi:putative transposase
MADFALYTGARLAELRRLRWSDMNLVDRFVTLRSPWATFLKAHWGAIAAMDFFKVEVMTMIGPVRYSVLVVMDLETRHVAVAGIVREAYERWMIQIVRHLTDAVGGFLIGKTHLIMDRDPVFAAGVRNMLRHAGAKPVRLPRRSPNLKG